VRPVDPRLSRAVPSVRGFLATTGALGVVSTLAIIAQAALIAHIVAAVFRGSDGLADLRGALLALLIVIAVRATLAWAQEATAARAAGRMRTQLRGRLLRRAFALGPGWIVGQGSGGLTQLATHGVDSTDPYVTRYLPQLVLAVVAPVLVVIQLALADLLSAVIVLVTLPLMPVFAALVGWTTERRIGRQVTALQRLSHHFLDVLDGLPVLRAYNRGQAQGASIRKATDAYRVATMSVLRLSFLSSFVLELTATLSVALVAVSIGLRLDGGHIGFRTALFVLILVPEAYLPLRALGTGYHAAAEGRTAIGQVLDVLELAAEPAPDDQSPVVATTSTNSGLHIDGLTVTHAGRERPALADVTVSVRPGELVALVAPSGGGKSTLIDATLGLIAGDAGRITFNGTSLQDTERPSWWRRIAWVPQRPALVAGTVSDNVVLGAAGATHGEVVKALSAAAADTIHPDLVLGEDGVGLSAGQRQRVAVARALLRCTHGADLVLLDEPTEHLDHETEAALLRALTAVAHDPVAPRCVLMATHRPAAIAAADRVVRLPSVQPVARAADAVGVG
jgi:thiol reductant ABC exporter CydD subunit